jgi:hypothetical protein
MGHEHGLTGHRPNLGSGRHPGLLTSIRELPPAAVTR